MKWQLMQYWNVFAFLLPLGVVGFWRWSVWLIKKFISLFYRAPKGNFFSTLSIVTPVYNENPEMFRLALESWKLNNPDEIIAVIDHTNPELIKIFEKFAAGFVGAKLIVTLRPGKRGALADGIMVSRGEIIALVDSDTIWSFNIKHRLLAPFSDPDLGGLTTRQDVLETNTLARKLFKILLDERYLLEYPFLTTVSDALLCLSGRTAVYRRKAIIDKTDALENETFWGEKMISGDDKTLTNFVHADGWKTVFLKDVIVYTPGAQKLGSFLKQKLRWARNGLRSDSRVLLGGWVWKGHKILALYMLDKVVAPIALLLGPIYFGSALYFGYWKAAMIIAVWWILSRAIKILPHLRERPVDILILPVYVLMTYVMAVIKIYAFFTLDKQGWITRWDSSRLNSLHPLRQVVSLVATTVFIGGYFLLVSSFSHQTVEPRPLKTKTKIVADIVSNETRLISSGELAKKRNLTIFNKNGAYGTYLLKSKDTLSALQKKFNLNNISSIKYEGGAPIADINRISAGKKIIIPVNELRKPLDASVLLDGQSAKNRPVISYDKKSNTIFIKKGGSVVNLSAINTTLSDKSVLEEKKPGEWLLRSNLYVGKNVTLVISKEEASYLKLKSDASGHIWVRSQGGNILISNTKITSWDETKNLPDLNYKDGRSFIVAKSSGRMDVINSEIAYLGYEGLPRRGGPFGGSYGLSWKITSGSFGDNLLTGVVSNNSIHDNYFGLYTFGVTGAVIKNNEVFENIQYGIDPHDDSNNLLITNNNSHDNGNHGIIVSKRCINNEISNNISHDNKLHGIMLDRASNNNVVSNNILFGNIDGIALYESNDNLISQNSIYQNDQGIRLNKKSSSNYVEKNKIVSNKNGIHLYGESARNIFLENEVTGNNVGISIQNAFGNAFYDSLKSLENKKDVYITVNNNENEIKR